MDYSKRPGFKVDKIGEIINEEKPTISIITPFYNGGKTLMETANGVFSQTYPYFEWIIVDDGSKDQESLEKLENLSKMDSRIKVFHKENGGPAMARDFGISKANKDTKYIFFLDCDDVPDKTMIECLYWTLETHKDASFAYTKMINFGDKEFLWERYLTVEQQKTENLICISSMVRKEDLIEVGCFGIKEKSMYEDWNLWLKLLEKGKKPIRVNAPLFWYRVSGTGEFSRAQKNNNNAMKYVNETASKIKNDVDIIQFPREGERLARVKDYPKMVLPNYKKSNKKKILFIFPWMVVGGADYFNLDIIKRLDHDKYESIILTTLPNENELRQEFELNASQVYDMSTFLERSDYIKFTDYIISSRKIDMVFISNSQYGYYMTPYLKNKYPNIPFIDYIHSIDKKDIRGGFGKASVDVNKYINKTYCCNNFTCNELKELYHKDKVETLYIGTDIKKYNPEKFNVTELKEKYGIPFNKKIVTFIARLSHEKRPEMFVKIAKELLKKDKNLFFIIAGDGYLYKKIKKQINSNFKMLGMIKESEEIYAISDVTINCSSLEGLALTSYESLAMNVPVISTDVGGQTELIDNKVGAIIHYNENATKDQYEKEIQEYVTKTYEILNNLEEYKKNCRNKILKNFSLDNMILKLSKIIDKSIEEELKLKKYSTVIDYSTYELALEIMYKNYYFNCKNYIEPKFQIFYDEDHDKKKYKKQSKLSKRFENMFRRCGAIYNITTIRDFNKSIVKLGKSLKETFILFIKSILACAKIIIKVILRNR